MSTERSEELRGRAAKHAALSDASRLAIVDALALSDLSPGEIGRMLGAPSNLVAHHVRALRDAGLVRRVPSEGDARRQYVQLVPGALDDLVAAPRWSADRVLFICKHNSARSQLAAALWRQLSRMPVVSAGTQPAARVHPGAVAVARRHKVPMPNPRPQHLSDVLRATDLLITVCDEAHEELPPDATARMLHWSVPDPVRVGSAEAFDVAFDQISTRVRRTATVVVPNQEGVA